VVLDLVDRHGGAGHSGTLFFAPFLTPGPATKRLFVLKLEASGEANAQLPDSSAHLYYIFLQPQGW